MSVGAYEEELKRWIRNAEERMIGQSLELIASIEAEIMTQ